MEHPWKGEQLQSGHGRPGMPLIFAGLGGKILHVTCLSCQWYMINCKSIMDQHPTLTGNLQYILEGHAQIWSSQNLQEFCTKMWRVLPLASVPTHSHLYSSHLWWGLQKCAWWTFLFTSPISCAHASKQFLLGLPLRLSVCLLAALT